MREVGALIQLTQAGCDHGGQWNKRDDGNRSCRSQQATDNQKRIDESHPAIAGAWREIAHSDPKYDGDQAEQGKHEDQQEHRYSRPNRDYRNEFGLETGGLLDGSTCFGNLRGADDDLFHFAGALLLNRWCGER